MAAEIRFESVSEKDARCLAEALRAYDASVEPGERLWQVEVHPNDDDEDPLVAVVDAALMCYANGEVTGFALVADGHRIVLGPRDELGA